MSKNVVTKLVDEIKWGAMLGVMQSDMDKTSSLLSIVVKQVGEMMRRRECELLEQGVTEPSVDGIYNRCFQLQQMLGGILFVMQGADCMLSGVIAEMLRDLDEK